MADGGLREVEPPAGAGDAAFGVDGRKYHEQVEVDLGEMHGVYDPTFDQFICRMIRPALAFAQANAQRGTAWISIIHPRCRRCRGSSRASWSSTSTQTNSVTRMR